MVTVLLTNSESVKPTHRFICADEKKHKHTQTHTYKTFVTGFSLCHSVGIDTLFNW